VKSGQHSPETLLTENEKHRFGRQLFYAAGSFGQPSRGKSKMKCLTRFFAFLLIVSSSSLSGIAQEKRATPPVNAGGTIVELDPAAWKEFSSQEGGFAVLLPGTPFKESRSSVIAGQQIVINLYALETNLQYLMSYGDALQIEESKLTKEDFDALAKLSAEKFSVKVTKMTEISVEGHAGRFVKAISPEGWLYRGKIYFVGKRFYNLAVITPGTEGSSPELVRFCETMSTKFLDSFKLLAPVTETLGEVDRMLRDAKTGVVIGQGLDNGQEKPASTHTVSGGVLEAKITSKPQPEYPAIARAARASGVVVVKVIVDEEGKVIAAQVESGHPLLQLAAVKAARLARFGPTLLDGKPVKVLGAITYNFVLQ
jgi:TonB family protein